jgi:RNA polymerase sigma-70 factor (ECF subfamily)
MYSLRMAESSESDGVGADAARANHVDRAFEEVYQQLRRIARVQLNHQPEGHTLQTTALVHEAYLKLKGSAVTADRGHFLRLAADAMRQILVDHARTKKRLKRGGGFRRDHLIDVATLAVSTDSAATLALDEALCRFEVMDPRAASIIKLRFFAGLSLEETAEATGLSVRTVNRDWKLARAWLHKEMGDREP